MDKTTHRDTLLHKGILPEKKGFSSLRYFCMIQLSNPYSPLDFPLFCYIQFDRANSQLFVVL